VFQITDGGGTRRPFDQPARTASSHPKARPIGSTRPSSTRVHRHERTTLGCADVAAGSSVIVMDTEDMGQFRISILECQYVNGGPIGPPFAGCRLRPGGAEFTG